MSGQEVDTNIYSDSEVTSLSIVVTENLIFQSRDGTQRNFLDTLNDAIFSTTVVTFDLDTYTIPAGQLPILDSSEDLSIDTLVVDGSTDATVDHKLTVAGIILYSEDGAGLFNQYETDVSGFVDSLGSLRGVVNASTEIYLGNGVGSYIKVGLAVTGLFGLLPAVEYNSSGSVLRRSLHRFGFGLENFAVEVPVSIDVENYVPDFILENSDSGNAFVFNYNNFKINIGVDASGNFFRSLGAFSVQFVSNTDVPLKITPVSARAKEYADSWLEYETHNFHSLYKGLFGQMLVNSGIVPVELTLDKVGIAGESFLGYITDDSLERNVIPKFRGWVSSDSSGGSFFEQEHAQIMTNLETSFRNIWSVDENAEWYANLYNSVTSGPIFAVGDTFSVPLEVAMRYKIATDEIEPDFAAGMKGAANLDPVAVSISNIVSSLVVESEEKWRFVYKFNVVDASGAEMHAIEGTVSSGAKIGYTVLFYSLKTGSLLHTNSTKTNSFGRFVTDANFIPDDSLYKVVSSNADGTGYDGITLEVNAGEEISAIFDIEETSLSPMCTTLTSLLADSVDLGVTKEFFYAKKVDLESKMSSVPGFNLNINPYLEGADATLAAEISKKVLEIEAIQESMASILLVDAGGLTATALKRKIRQGMAQMFDESVGVVDLTDLTTVETVIDKSAKSVLGESTDTSSIKTANKAGLIAMTTSLATSSSDGDTLVERLLNMHKKAKQIRTQISSVGVASVDISGIDAASFGSLGSVEIFTPVITDDTYAPHIVTHYDGTVVDNYLIDTHAGLRSAIIVGNTNITGIDATWGNYVTLGGSYYILPTNYDGIITEEFSMSFVIRPTDVASNWGTLFGNWKATESLSMWIGITNNNHHVNVRSGQAIFPPIQSLTNNEWSIVSYIWDGSTIKIYENTTEVGSVSNTNINFGYTWWLGSQRDFTGSKFDGDMASAIILNKVVSITALIGLHS
jgi:hypothetical protein